MQDGSSAHAVFLQLLHGEKFYKGQTLQVENTIKVDAAFESFSNELFELIVSKRFDEFTQRADEFIGGDAPLGQRLLVEGLYRQLQGRNTATMELYGKARDELGVDRCPASGSLYTTSYITAQMSLPRRKRPANELGYRNFKANLAVLRELDKRLAEEVQAARWPDDLMLAETWDGLRFFNPQQQVVYELSRQVEQALQKPTTSREGIAFGRIMTGQELRYCLEHPPEIFMTMARGHYLFEPDAGRVRALLHLMDVSRFLQSRELVIFGGQGMSGAVLRFFGTLRYMMPRMTIGDLELVDQYTEGVIRPLLTNDQQQQVRAYYSGDEFAGRLADIAAGKIMPRILVDTCRWTTFLKYCAADFEKAFKGLGCQTLYTIEQDDVQTNTLALQWQTLNEFKPDLVFMVSHARATADHYPKELPFIGFLQDKCGPIADADDLTGRFQRHDLFVCMFSNFVDYLKTKKVPAGQCFVLPTPADESMFYPLDRDDKRAGEFTVDVSFVKHGHPEPEKMLEEFFSRHFANIDEPQVKQALVMAFRQLHEWLCGDLSICRYEDEILKFLIERLPTIQPEDRQSIVQVMTTYYLGVYSCAWRGQFLEALDRAGVDLTIYGNGWAQHTRLKHLCKGPVDRARDLNHVYNFSKINLSIMHTGTMHQRLAECGLAGGFLMAANHDEKYDWEPARRWFQADKEVVFFNSCDDLVNKCKYYLEHDNERLTIAENMHKRAARERTCKAAARTVLQQWQQLYKTMQG